jgi:ATP-dependent Lon protease
MSLSDDLDRKLNEIFEGKVVRKDLLHRIKKGTNVPTFVLEFLLARFCASSDEAELDAGMEAVLDTLQDNYVRPDEANAKQSLVATHGKHRFIDKVHVRYVEREKRHWASLENFNSQRIAIGEKWYRDNDRLLEGGLWAEVTVAHNAIEEDDYTFYIEDLRPIQLSRFDFDRYVQGRREFTRDQWLNVILRSVGLEPQALSPRARLHYIARMAALVETNYNYIELGPRGTGKSYFFSEFSPYATLISGGQATKSVLFYNNARRKIGLVGYWDVVAFDEVGGIKVRDPDTIQIMKDFMANGRFSRGVEVIADASMSFVGNIDLAVEQVVNSTEYDLFQPLPEELDLAVMDRFAAYIPGWEVPKNSSEYLTSRYGFITDYLAEAFHHQFKHVNRYEEVSQRIRLGRAVEGRDEKGIKKTVAAFLKILHPGGKPTDAEFEEYVAYAIECRRRVKEQMNKRKPDDEFAKIGLSYISASGAEVEVWCPESRHSPATQTPARRNLNAAAALPPSKIPDLPAAGAVTPTPVQALVPASAPAPSATVSEPVSVLPVAAAVPVMVPLVQAAVPVEPVVAKPIDPVEQSPTAGGAVGAQPGPAEYRPADSSSPADAVEQHFTILYGDTGHSYESIVGPYLRGASAVVVEDPYIRMQHQIQNFVRFCEVLVRAGSIRKLTLVTSYDANVPQHEAALKFDELKQSLLEVDVELEVKLNPNLHDREIRVNNGWVIKIGRGLDFYQKPASWFEVGAHDMALRKCLETKVDIFRS